MAAPAQLSAALARTRTTHRPQRTQRPQRTERDVRLACDSTLATWNSFRTSFRSSIDRGAVLRHQVLLRGLLNVRRCHLVQFTKNRVDPVRVVVVQRERGEQVGAAEARNDAALEALEERRAEIHLRLLQLLVAES